MSKEDLEMKATFPFGIFAIVVFALCLPAAAAEVDPRDSLRLRDIASLRIDLNPWGAQLGFEIEVPGHDPRVGALVEVIHKAEPGGGHKCPNSGAMRFRLKDGSIIGVGLLRSHTAGVYELRLYDGDRFVDAYRVDRAALLNALADLGVPTDDPAFEE